MSAARSDLAGHLAFGPWWLLYSGPLGPSDLHAHHAFQVVVHAGTPCVVDEDRRPMPGPIVVIEPDRRHAFIAQRDHALIVYVDPESNTGGLLRSHRTPAAPMDQVHPVSSIVGALRPQNWSRAEEAVRRILASVCDAPDAHRMTWWRHAALESALLRIPALDDARTVDVAALARESGLSIDRLDQVFSGEIGVPLHSYARWMRLVHAVEHLANGHSVADAAHAAGFAHGGHFDRTFQAMFGLNPAEAVASGTWLLP